VKTGESFHRLIAFTDAVIAIAMTLLVLPLVEIGTDLDPTSESSVWDVLRDHQSEIAAFVISFLVAWGLWRSHHQMMDGFRGYDTAIVMWHLVWLFTIVLLAFTTQLLNAGDLYSRGAPALYIGNLLLSSIALTGINWHGHRRPALLAEDNDPADFDVVDSFSTVVVLVLCLVLVLIWPPLGAWPLLLLLVDGPIVSLLKRVRRRSSDRTAIPADQ
jgi:TMEM175 potassium channel family protein